MYAHIRRVRVDAGPLAATGTMGAKHIADRVFDAQRDEVETFYRRFDGRYIHA